MTFYLHLMAASIVAASSLSVAYDFVPIRAAFAAQFLRLVPMEACCL